MFESQKVSESRIKELANAEKLEVTLQEARGQGSEIVHVGWLDDAARGTPEDLDAVGAEWARLRSSRMTVKMWCRRHYQSMRPGSCCVRQQRNPTQRINTTHQVLVGDA